MIQARARLEAVDELSDREAIERCRNGDPGHVAFRCLYDRYSPEVFALLKRVLRGRGSVEDALQDVFLRVHRSLGGFDLTRPLRPWLLQIARNVAIDALGAVKRTPVPVETEDDRLPPGPSHVIEDVAANERREVIDEALAALAPEPRILLILRFRHGLTYDEIAETDGVTKRTVCNRLRAAVALLERELVRRGAASLALEVRP